MDKELTIAQMQGKFKVVVIHNVGHSVHEDDFKSTARECYNFLKDFRVPMTLQERAEKELVGIAQFHPHLQKYWSIDPSNFDILIFLQSQTFESVPSASVDFWIGFLEKSKS